MSSAQAQSIQESLWPSFQQINRSRRAIRDFTAEQIPLADLDAICQEAGLAPSSQGLQPYELHLVTSPAAKERVALACHGQRAARTAPALIAVVVGPALSRRRISEAEQYYQATQSLTQRSRDYHLKALKLLKVVHHGLLLPLLTMLHWLLSLWSPSRSLLPIGAHGVRNWAARSAMLAAQTLMLAAAARGVDSCPMEGFSGPNVARALALPAGSVVVVIVALGYRATDARVEPQWRRDATQLIRKH